MFSWFGHQSRLVCARVPPENGHLGLVVHRSLLLLWFAMLRPDPSANHSTQGWLSGKVDFNDRCDKFILMDQRHIPAASLFRCAGASWPLRTCGRSLCDLAAGLVDADQGTGGSPGRRAARARRATSRLTKFGEEIAQRVRDILRSVDELGDFARASRERLVGRLRIGMIPTIAPYLLPTVIGNLTRMHPELDIHVRETLTPKLIRGTCGGPA